MTKTQKVRKEPSLNTDPRILKREPKASHAGIFVFSPARNASAAAGNQTRDLTLDG